MEFAARALGSLLLTLWVGCTLPASWRRPDAKAVASCREHLQQGRTALERGDAAAAEQLLAAAVQACPRDADARRHYAEALWQRGQSGAAVAQFRMALAEAPQNGELHLRCGELHYEMGDLSAARAEADAAIRQAPELGSAWFLRGRVGLAEGQPQRALADLHRGLSSAPGDQQALLAVADTYLALDQPRRALATVDRLQEDYLPGEEPPAILLRIGRAYLALGRGPDAVERLSSVVARVPATAPLWYLLAEAERTSGHPELARQHALRALALDPQHAPSLALAGAMAVPVPATERVRR